MIGKLLGIAWSVLVFLLLLVAVYAVLAVATSQHEANGLFRQGFAALGQGWHVVTACIADLIHGK